MSNATLDFEKTIKSPPSQVYRAFTNATALREWCCDVATVDPKAGGRLYMAWNAGFYMAGEYTNLVEDQTVAFTWQGKGEPGVTNVDVNLAKSDEGTKLTLTHNGIGYKPGNLTVVNFQSIM